jgi:hypothetical protein
VQTEGTSGGLDNHARGWAAWGVVTLRLRQDWSKAGEELRGYSGFLLISPFRCGTLVAHGGLAVKKTTKKHLGQRGTLEMELRDEAFVDLAGECHLTLAKRNRGNSISERSNATWTAV